MLNVTIPATESENCGYGPPGGFPANLSGDSVTNARDLQASPHTAINDTVWGVTFQWKVPIDGISRQHLKGFYLEMDTVGSGAASCDIFDVKELGMADNLNVRFSTTCVFDDGETYRILLLSLPSPTRKEYIAGLQRRTVVSIPKRQNPKVDPDKWTTWVLVQTHESKIEVKFGFPGNNSSAKFNRYLVQLVIPGTPKKLVQEKNVDSASSPWTFGVVNFTHVQNGTYIVQVEPKDTHLNKDPCQCYKITNNVLKTCGTCTTTITEPFSFTSPLNSVGTDTHFSITTTPGTPQITTTPGIPQITTTPGTPQTSGKATENSTYFQDTEDTNVTVRANTGGGQLSTAVDTGQFVPAVVVAFMLLGVILAGFCWWKRRKATNQARPDFDPDEKSAPEPSEESFKQDVFFSPSLISGMLKTEPLVTRKKVLLLASEDHEYFSQALNNFSTFLTLHCQCDVMCTSERLADVRKTDNSYIWLSGKIDQADFVIIIASEAAFQLYQAYQKGLVYKSADLGPEGDLFTLGIQDICGRITRSADVSKMIMVHFEHTATEFLLPIPALPPWFYCLPNRLTSFLLHIHGLVGSTMNLSKVNLPLQGNVDELNGGQEWLSAVEECKAFERANPRWFAETFGRPYVRTNKEHTQNARISGDSGFGSHLRQLSNEVNRELQSENGFTRSGSITKSEFIPPSVHDNDSIYTVPYSICTASERPLEIDEGCAVSDQFRMINEHYAQDRKQEQQQQRQAAEPIPEELRSAVSDQSENPFAQQNLSYPNALPTAQECGPVEVFGYDRNGDCVSVSSAQSV
ncbi:hypothetical protein V1264_012012 [Littorina saxatilis]|uniref:SEFIR domain-containing protein n=1 Tax=Littorina saxatilis TaxID=31220 RepID=A0AAN9GL50_9CAEN